MNGAKNNGPDDRGYAMLGAVLGALLVHPIAFVLAYVKGFVLGAGGGQVPMAATRTFGTVRYGLSGGEAGVGELLVLYVFSVGIVPLVLSVIGGAAGYRFGPRLASTGSVDNPPPDERPATTSAIAWITAVWAAGLYVIGFVVMTTVVRLGSSAGWEVLRWLLPLLHAGIWGGGAIAAYFRHRSWQVSAALVTIGVLLRVLPVHIVFGRGYGLLFVAILFLIYAGIMRQLPSRKVGVADPGSGPAAPRSSFGAWTAFFLGGITFYASLCLFCVVWMMSLGPNSENWGPGMLLILGAWGVPVFGGIAASVHAWTGPWTWLTPRAAWISVGAGLSVCLLIWLSLLIH